jgi:hypothetical protein
MGKKLDLGGKQFGRWTVLERGETYTDTKGKRRSQWLCRCECGTEKLVLQDNLVRGLTKSCGCYEKERARELISKNRPKGTEHGMSDTRIYKIWDGIKQRCYRTYSSVYEYYGGRGITVCDEWKEDFMSFYTWAMKNGYSDELTIDRKDVNGNYEPSNCRWATMKEQQNNKTNNHFLTINNETHTVTEWERIANLPPFTIFKRLRSNWEVNENILTQPIDKVLGVV